MLVKDFGRSDWDLYTYFVDDSWEIPLELVSSRSGKVVLDNTDNGATIIIRGSGLGGSGLHDITGTITSLVIKTATGEMAYRLSGMKWKAIDLARAIDDIAADYADWGPLGRLMSEGPGPLRYDTTEAVGDTQNIMPGYATDRLIFKGGRQDDLISGSPQNDRIKGRIGEDTLQGSGGDDIINGGGGYDQISGDGGNDTLRGGPGADSFLFYIGDDTGSDVILDFNPDQGDRLEFFGTGMDDVTVKRAEGGASTLVIHELGEVLLRGVARKDVADGNAFDFWEF